MLSFFTMSDLLPKAIIFKIIALAPFEPPKLPGVFRKLFHL